VSVAFREPVPYVCIMCNFSWATTEEFDEIERNALAFAEELARDVLKISDDESFGYVCSAQSTRDVWNVIINATLKGDILHSPSLSTALATNTPGFHYSRDVFPHFIELKDMKLSEYLNVLLSFTEGFIDQNKKHLQYEALMKNMSIIKKGLVKKNKSLLLHLLACLEAIRKSTYYAGDWKEILKFEAMYDIVESLYVFEMAFNQEFAEFDPQNKGKKFVPVTVHLFDRWDDSLIRKYRNIFTHVFTYFPSPDCDVTSASCWVKDFTEQNPNLCKISFDKFDCWELFIMLLSKHDLLRSLMRFGKEDFFDFVFKAMEPLIDKLNSKDTEQYNLACCLKRLNKIAIDEVHNDIIAGSMEAEELKPSADDMDFGFVDCESKECKSKTAPDIQNIDFGVSSNAFSKSSSLGKIDELLTTIDQKVILEYDLNKGLVYDTLGRPHVQTFTRKAVREMKKLGWSDDEIISKVSSFVAGVIELVAVAEGGSSSKGARKPITNVFRCPPDVIFNYEVSNTPYKRIEREWQKISSIIDEELPVIGKFAKLLVKGYLVPMLKGKQVQVPLFVGPPSTGKTFLPQVLADVLSQIGIKTICLVESAAKTSHHDDNNFIHAVLGSEPHWSNAFHGKILKSIMDGYELVIVVADEIDKRTDHHIFLELFDVSQPLQDIFFKHVAPFMNLRRRTMFIATANEYNISDSAVKSRVSKIPWQYTIEEKRKIFEKLVHKKVPELEQLPENRRKTILETCMKLLETASIRELISVANQMAGLSDEPELFECALETISKSHFSSDKKQIGF